MGYWLNQNFKYSAFYNFGYERYRKEVDKLNYNGAVHSFNEFIDVYSQLNPILVNFIRFDKEIMRLTDQMLTIELVPV